MEASVEDLIEYYTKRHVGDCELTCVHDTDTVEALTELRKLREENARLSAMLVAGNELTNKACAMLSRLTGEPWPPKPPEVG